MVLSGCLPSCFRKTYRSEGIIIALVSTLWHCAKFFTENTDPDRKNDQFPNIIIAHPMKKTEPPVVVEQIVPTPPDVTWRALTDIDWMRQWYFPNIPDFRPEEGFQTAFPVVNEGRTFTHQWRIVEVVPMARIAYTWTYAEYPGEGLVTFSLEPVGHHTRVRLTCEVREDFDDSIPEFRRESCQAGWEYFIRQALPNFLEKNHHS